MANRFLRAYQRGKAKRQVTKRFKELNWTNRNVAILTHKCEHRKSAIYTLAFRLLSDLGYHPRLSGNIFLMDHAKALIEAGYKKGWRKEKSTKLKKA